MYKKVSVTITITLVIAVILTVSTSAPQRSYAQAGEILQIHNAERAAIGASPLSWSESLAADAQSYAQHLATLGRLVHCDQAGLTGAAAAACDAQGENLAAGSPSGALNEVREVQDMAAEKSNIPSGFSGASYLLKPPIGHYTQMVWKNTREVGCGTSQTADKWFFVCRYSPPGNYVGQMYK